MNSTRYPLILALSLAVIGSAGVDAGKDQYPNMAPLEKYLSASQSAEIALARSAGPASVSDKAEILVLSARGYETVVKGTNGFVCYVARSWDNDVDNAEFWNPKLRAPMCLNRAAARSYLPYYLQRTQWVLSGVSRAEIIERIKAAITAKQIVAPEAGAMSFMLSKDGYLGDAAAGPWHPHVMFYGPPGAGAEWGADVPGSPVISAPSDLLPLTMFFVPVRTWSDGTLATYGG
jgi:hypothetical protein